MLVKPSEENPGLAGDLKRHAQKVTDRPNVEAHLYAGASMLSKPFFSFSLKNIPAEHPPHIEVIFHKTHHMRKSDKIQRFSRLLADFNQRAKPEVNIIQASFDRLSSISNRHMVINDTIRYDSCSLYFCGKMLDSEEIRIKTRPSRNLFFLAVLFCLALSYWAFSNYVGAEANQIRISARPVPAAPFIDPAWLDKKPMMRVTEAATLGKGGTLAELLTNKGIDAVTADSALDALQPLLDPRTLQEGQKLRLFYEWKPGASKETAEFAGFDLIPAPTKRIIVRKLNDGRFKAVSANRPLTEKHFYIDTEITSSLYQSARNAGMAPSQVIELIRMYSFTVDFQREIREGDRLEVLYTRLFDPDGKQAATGKILYTGLTIKGERQAYWHYKARDDDKTYYLDENGSSMSRLLMKTPLDGARLSSRYGLRKHPILGFTRLHRGVDFAARRGTPVFAAGNGVIAALGVEGNHGKRIRINHVNNYKTLYAHLNGYARGLKTGSPVTQGQVIGYVGATGLATGPHLHYEITYDGRSVNPLTIEMPILTKLDEEEKVEFDRTRQNLTRLAQDLAAGLEPLESQ